MSDAHSRLKQDIRKALEAEGALVIPYHSGPYSGPGTSDLLVLWPGGRFVAVEVKTFGETLTDEQKAFFRRVERRGGIAVEGHSPQQVVRDILKIGKGDYPVSYQVPRSPDGS